MAVSWTTWDGQPVAGFDGFDPMPVTLSIPGGATTSLAQLVQASLFTDARADDSDTLPVGETDRRGWWADAFADGDNFGSLIWLHMRKGLSARVVEDIRQAAADALVWLVDDGIAAAVDVTAERSGGTLALGVVVTAPDGTTDEYRYRGLWEGV